MKVFVGLGNPGEDYNNTRHNFGFSLLDYLSKKIKVEFEYKKKFDSKIAEAELANQKVFLLKPQTFMNNSGEVIKRFINFYKIDTKDIVVIYDDFDIELGTYRTSGIGSAGHRGMKSIMEALKTNDIARYRLGINSPNRGVLAADVFVLDKFTDSEIKQKESVINNVAEKIIDDLGNNYN